MEEPTIHYKTCKWVKPVDLNPNDCLFGGKLLQWIDEEAALFAVVQLGNRHIVTKHISAVNFLANPKRGDIIEIGIGITHFGNTSLTLTCLVRDKLSRQLILTIDKIVFVNLDAAGNPSAHGKTTVTNAGP